jgi:hypothetical protein
MHKNNEHLKTFTQWLSMVVTHIQTYNRVVLESANPGDPFSDFAWFYRKSTDSYFLSVLRNLIDKDSRVSSILIFADEFLKEEFSSFLGKIKDGQLTNSDVDTLNKFAKTYQEIVDTRSEIYKNYNCWMNEYNSHLNTKRLSSVFEEEKIKRPDTDEVIGKLTRLI